MEIGKLEGYYFDRNKNLKKNNSVNLKFEKVNPNANRYEYLCVFDQNYIYPFFVSLFSLKQNSKYLDKIYIASNYEMLPENSREIIRRFCKLVNIKVIFLEIVLGNNLPVSKGFNSTTYAKLYSISQMNKNFVYFDVDMLFVGDIDLIWNSEFQPEDDFVLSARPDPGIVFSDSNNRAILHSNGLYFNAGFMVINPSKWITGGFETEFPRVIENYSHLGFEWLDQCVFNFLVSGKYVVLPRKFNHIVGEGDFYPEDSIVFHFAGSHKKPWRVPIRPFRRIIYLRQENQTKPYVLYLSFERKLFNFLKEYDATLLKRVLEFRRIEFSKAPHLIDLILFKFEMRKYGWLVKYLHRVLTLRRKY